MRNNNKERQEVLSHLDTMEEAFNLAKDAFEAIDADSLVVTIKSPGLVSAQVNGNKQALALAIGCTMLKSEPLRTVIMDAMTLFAELMKDQEKTLDIEVIKVNENNPD